jgi:hypothetical protein
MSYETMTESQMRLPMQAAPVDRTPSTAALGGAGVDASGWFDLLKTGIGAIPDIIDIVRR